LAAAIQAVLEPLKFQLIVKEDVGDAEFLLARGAIDTAILDAELTDARAIRIIEELKSYAPVCPVIVYATAKQWEWEEDAYLLGVAHVLTKPVRGKLLNTLLGRMFPEHESKAASMPTAAAAMDGNAARLYNDQVRALEALRRFRKCSLTASIRVRC
jgi:DNA-binding NtrC family response regulator